ncbi:MAG TPA: peptidylprolyl isomerase [Gammaproteobacteria bacterium]|jgi:cyclophilin family peptidyl-prolyl cis-trans isomerase
MRASLALLTLVLVTACSQAPVQPAPAQTSPPASEASPYPVPPPPVAPPPQVQPPAPAAPQVQEAPVDKDHREVLIHTNMGDILLQLDAVHAPVTAKHFLTNVQEHYFDGSAFYRVMPGFVIQGGDYNADLEWRAPKHKAIPFESTTLTNQRGSIAMAHLDPNSANGAFFINLVDNTPQFTPTPGNPGYAVFGQVVRGMDVVDKIAAMDTHEVTFVDGTAPFEDVPVKPVKILKVSLLPLPQAGKP